MRIAQVAPLWEAVPPLGYGGIELVVGLLTDELVRRGHEVTLFASGDSRTLAKLEPGCDVSLRKKELLPADYVIYEQLLMGKVFSRANEFDIIHSHVDYAALPYAALTKTPVVFTTHFIIDEVVANLFKANRQQNFLSISNSQRRNDLGLNYVETVYNAIAVDRFEFHPQPDQEDPYLVFLGRMGRVKGPHLAIEIAKRSGWKLKMAGKVDFRNEQFFKAEVEPHIDGDQIQFLGEADHAMKNKLMGQATATLFPIDWEEPFGLVMPESMASGTPVIALNRGSVPEVIQDGKTGFVCEGVSECVAAVSRLGELNRQTCRAYVESRFATSRMVDDYEAVYRPLLQEKFSTNGHAKAVGSLSR